MSDFIPACADGPLGQSAAFLFCDHTTNAVPGEYGTLGLSAEQFGDHIAFDPGAAALTAELSRRLQARAVYCQFSRLLIDPNRGTERDDLIVTQSDGVVIPANQKLADEERNRRLQRFYHPYHNFLSAELDAHQAATKNPLIVSIHSFCRTLRDVQSHRPWHVGVLWKDDEPTAQTLMAALRAKGLEVGDNEPYSGKIYNYTIDRHVQPRGLRHVTLELRQDLIANTRHVQEWAALLAAPLRGLIEQ